MAAIREIVVSSPVRSIVQYVHVLSALGSSAADSWPLVVLHMRLLLYLQRVSNLIFGFGYRSCSRPARCGRFAIMRRLKVDGKLFSTRESVCFCYRL